MNPLSIFSNAELHRLFRMVQLEYSAEKILRVFPGREWAKIKQILIEADVVPPKDPPPVAEAEQKTNAPLPQTDSFSVLVNQATREAEALGDTMESIMRIMALVPTEPEFVEYMEKINELWLQIEEPRMPFHRFAVHLLFRNFIIFPRPILKPILPNATDHTNGASSSN